MAECRCTRILTVGLPTILLVFGGESQFDDLELSLLQKTWFPFYYAVLCTSSPYPTKYFSFNPCLGFIMPVECSGLMVLSRFGNTELTKFEKIG
jgi:hypothetical protein